jgi:formylglycine-generating enzyme required for sulfatase activity
VGIFPAQPVREPPRSFRDCPECPEMVVVPAGSTRLASGRDVTIAAPFAIGKFEITFDEWDACVAAAGFFSGGCRHRPIDRGWGRGRQPVINVSWDDAQQYVAWLSQRTGTSYRLLSEAEWEYAAQAGTGRDQSVLAGSNEANCDGCGSRWDNTQTAPVGSFAPNPFGLHDILGNVWEWTAEGVLLGGSWVNLPESTHSARRSRSASDLRDGASGFRVARTL